MRRSLVVTLALLASIGSQAVAQTCKGLASFSTGRMQVTGNGSFTQGRNTFGGSLGYGLPASVFGGATVSTTSIDALNGSSTNLGANAGYQLTLGKAAQMQMCPVASFEIGMGPDDQTFNINQSSRRATVGLAVGTSMGANARMQIVPNAGLGLAYDKTKRDGGSGGPLVETSETYGLATLGVGIIWNSNISVRPSIDIPLGLDNSDPTLGLTVAYSFGRKSAAAGKR